jgi:hypothetical protein
VILWSYDRPAPARYATDNDTGLVREEREMKTAASRQWARPDRTRVLPRRP